MMQTSGTKVCLNVTTSVSLTREELNLLSNLLNNHIEQWSDSPHGEWCELREKLQRACKQKP